MHHTFNSSNILRARLDLDSRWMEVVFAGGGRYYYPNITADMFTAWTQAPSAGTWFTRHVRNADEHPFSRERPEGVEMFATDFDAARDQSAPSDASATGKKLSVRYSFVDDKWSIKIGEHEVAVKTLSISASASSPTPTVLLEVYASDIEVLEIPAELVEAKRAPGATVMAWFGARPVTEQSE